jgi:hypothetical protein
MIRGQNAFSEAFVDFGSFLLIYLAMELGDFCVREQELQHGEMEIHACTSCQEDDYPRFWDVIF